MTSTNLSKSTAIRAARRAVGQPIRISSTSYVVYGPYNADEPNGPSTEQNYDSYWKARAGRAEWVARVAVALMGRLSVDAGYAIDWAANDHRSGHDIESLVEAGLAATR